MLLQRVQQRVKNQKVSYVTTKGTNNQKVSYVTTKGTNNKMLVMLTKGTNK